MRMVIALGGNALLNPAGSPDFENYLDTVSKTCSSIAKLVAKGHQIILTHGNGTQIGSLLLQQEAARESLQLPLDVCGAETQGQIGYLLQQALRNELRKLKLEKETATVTTQVLIDKNDPGFHNPAKPVGPFYTEKEVGALKHYNLKRISGRFRRVVPSPKPIDIIEKESIKKMADSGAIVISCGGGGIPVITEGSQLKGIEAVIDKDRTAQLLANLLKADTLLIATDVEAVYLGYGRPDQKKLTNVKLREMKAYLKEGHFPPGSMGPKTEACIDFLENGGRKAVICSLEAIVEAAEGRKGTVITE